MPNILESIKSFFQPLSAAQKALFGLISTGLLVFVAMLFYWALQPSYSLLYGSLDPGKAQNIVEELESQGVSYKLEQQGQAIKVPSSKVYNLRLQFASQGMAGGQDYKGYELFDETTLGMTEFMQEVNRKRALEGELARTVNSLDQVESSRIHLVLPERSPFQESTVKPSASVTVKMLPGRTLENSQIEGIGRLIAGSVEGLQSENVVILDQQGNRISEDVLVDGDVGSGSRQMKVRRETESYLTHKGQTMLDKVLGPGNSILRVSTKHDFDQLIRDSNLIDPESRIVISEEERSVNSSDEDAEPVEVDQFTPPEQRESTVTTSTQNNESEVQVRNYEVSETRQHEEKAVGQISNISASILLNYKTVEQTGPNGTVEQVREPYTQQELEDIRQVVVNALGIKQERGDRLAVTQVKFWEPTDMPAPSFWEQPQNVWRMVRWMLVVLALGLIGYLVYRVSSSWEIENLPISQAEKDAEEADRNKSLEGETVDEDIYTNKLSYEAQKQLSESYAKFNASIHDFIDDNTDEAVNVVRTFMNQEAEAADG